MMVDTPVNSLYNPAERCLIMFIQNFNGIQLCIWIYSINTTFSISCYDAGNTCSMSGHQTEVIPIITASIPAIHCFLLIICYNSSLYLMYS